MPMVPATLAADLLAIFEDLSGKTAAQKANEIAAAVDAYIRTATVTTAVTTVVVNTAVPPVTIGAGAGSGTGSLS